MPAEWLRGCDACTSVWIGRWWLRDHRRGMGLARALLDGARDTPATRLQISGLATPDVVWRGLQLRRGGAGLHQLPAEVCE
jgi:hypothetical protein